MPIGARIRRSWERPDPALVAGLSELSASDISDAGGRHYVADPAIRHVAGGRYACGVALTVQANPADNLMIHAAIDRAQPGDVLVVAGGGTLDSALMGENVVAFAKTKGVVGIVVDGAVRDVDLLPLPTWSRGATPRKPGKAGAGEVGYPIGLGGVSVCAGDIVVADGDGVVIVPQAQAATVLEKARKTAVSNQKTMEQIAAGTYDRKWVAEALRAVGVEEED